MRKGKERASGDDGEQHNKAPEEGPIDLSSLSSSNKNEDDDNTYYDEDEEESREEPIPPLELEPLTPRSLLALRNLVRYGRRKSRWEGSNYGWHEWPRERRAAVLVALFGSRTGELNVVLSTRATHLRVNPGEVALPGGKMEPMDVDLEYTARREAFEEIGLPIDATSVRHLCNLPPFLARSTPLLVTPVVCLLLDASLKPKLNPSEVSSVFSHPLHSFLTNTPPSPHYVPDSVYNGTKPYRLQYDVNWLQDRPYRLFRFEGRTAPIWGFTADILVHAAMTAYGHEPEFERRAPGQLPRRELIRLGLEAYKNGTLPPPPSRLTASTGYTSSRPRSDGKL